MKKHYNKLIFIGLALVIVFLYGFASHRSSLRDEQGLNVVFENGENLFVSYETVNKLLIQKLNASGFQRKENINLEQLETYLSGHEMVENAEIYLTLSGELGAIIKQRTPVLRVACDTEAYYYDTQGKRMPLSDNYSARVPITADTISEEGNDDLIVLSRIINEDEFLKKQIIGIDRLEKREHFEYEMKTRVGEQKILLGDLQRIEKKIAKLKVFYNRTMLDSTYANYKTINLKFNDQIVCEK
jgi:cell division protein FtsQ